MYVDCCRSSSSSWISPWFSGDLQVSVVTRLTSSLLVTCAGLLPAGDTLDLGSFVLYCSSGLSGVRVLSRGHVWSEVSVPVQCGRVRFATELNHTCSCHRCHFSSSLIKLSCGTSGTEVASRWLLSCWCLSLNAWCWQRAWTSRRASSVSKRKLTKWTSWVDGTWWEESSEISVTEKVFPDGAHTVDLLMALYLFCVSQMRAFSFSPEMSETFDLPRARTGLWGDILVPITDRAVDSFCLLVCPSTSPV